MGLKVEDAFLCVWLNRIHLIFMLWATNYLLYGLVSGEYSSIPFFYDGISKPSRSLVQVLEVLLIYAIWALMDLIIYFPYHHRNIWSLNVVHHFFRIYLLYTANQFTSNSWDIMICNVTYIIQCMFLYVQHGKLYEGHSPYFRIPFKWFFFASIITRIVFYPAALYCHFFYLYNGEASFWWLLFRSVFPFVIFDVAYLYFHFCAPKPKEETHVE